MITGNYKTIAVEGTFLKEDTFARLKEALAWLRGEEWKTLPVGRHDIYGDDVYALVSEYTSKLPEDAKFEKHIRYIDVQMVIDGSEICYNTNDAAVYGNIAVPYKEDNDIMFFDGLAHGAHAVTMKEGNVAILFPDDAHMPAVMNRKQSSIRKVVIKVRV